MCILNLILGFASQSFQTEFQCVSTESHHWLSNIFFKNSIILLNLFILLPVILVFPFQVVWSLGY